MKKHITLIFIVLVNLSGCSFAQKNTEHIRLNQIGFLPVSQKIAAVVDADASEFHLKNKKGEIVFRGELSTAQTWISSGESVQIADFSLLSTLGTYTLTVPEYGTSVPFVIHDTVFCSVSNAIAKAFYFNRSGIELQAEYAEKHARKAGHPDNEVIILPSSAGPKRKAGDIISASKGWYDAGDYNKYIVNSSISVGALLLAYENYTNYFDTATWNIPESTNSIPDILDEIKWNVDWMLTMQDPDDGGVYNKTTSAHFSRVVMPHEDKGKRYVVAKSTAATLDFAATMALSYRIYKPFHPEFADSCLQAATKAWKWAEQHPDIEFLNPEAEQGFPSIRTGRYGDRHFEDEKIWAASELLIATKDEQTYAPHINLSYNFSIPEWSQVATMSLYSLYNHRSQIAHAIDTQKVCQNILNIAQKLQKYQTYENPYKVAAVDFAWGSTGVMANQGIAFLYALHITQDYSYFNAALSCFDYILGRNATGYSFVTGYGEKSSQNIHHRISEADRYEGSIPGFVAGGPFGGEKRDCYGKYSSYPAKAYYDGMCSYSTNEIAINWQAPLTYLAHGLIAEYKNMNRNKSSTYARCIEPTIRFNQSETQANTSIISNSDWEIFHEESWFFITPDESTGNSKVGIEITEHNTGDSIRTGYGYLSVDNKIVQTITIQQKGKLRNFRIEAEEAIVMKDVQTEKTDDKDGGMNVGWINNDDYMTYEITIPRTGSYQLTYRVASYDNSGSLILMDTDSVYSHIETYPTGDWQSWVDITDTAYFREGTHTLKLYVIQGGFNLNYIDFSFISPQNTNTSNIGIERFKDMIQD
ncbi:MAG: glycoside hydrolase family 9 protein [Bacteroidales bacterium]|jgi:endoglucanase|nr:glycoside hydrolase family 9 protein [Bacteroidales bacterium]